jgi:hypothetical protein
VSSELRSFLSFLEAQQAKQASHFPTVKYDKVLSFMGTTSLAGSHAAVSVNRLHALEAGGAGRELRIRLTGPLARRPEAGECISVHVTRVEQYQGYQVKTKPLAAGAGETDLVESGPDGLVVRGTQIFTVHHSPYTLKFFEHVPYEEVQETVGGVPYALVAVGETANLSPRFIFHHEEIDGRVALFHGDGLALKTYMNLKANRRETRLVLDLEDFSGFQLRGQVEEFAPHQHPLGYEKVCAGFSSGNWGKPSRVFRFVADSIEPIRPVG